MTMEYLEKLAKYQEITVKEIWFEQEVRNMCIKQKFYNKGTSEEYAKMLEFVRQNYNNPSTENLYIVAMDIAIHTDKNKYDEYTQEEILSNIMFYLKKDTVGTFYELV